MKLLLKPGKRTKPKNLVSGNFAEKIVIYGLAPETMNEELQKMQVKIKSVNNLTQTVAKAKAREKEIVNTFQTILKAKGESLDNFRSLSDFIGEERVVAWKGLTPKAKKCEKVKIC